MAKHKRQGFLLKTAVFFSILPLAVAGLVATTPAVAAPPAFTHWTGVDGVGAFATTGDGSHIDATVTLGGTGTHAIYGAGTGATNYKTICGNAVPSLNYETYAPGDYVEVSFATAISDVKAILGWVGPHDEAFVSASTDGTTFTGVDLTDSANVTATAVAYNTLPTTLTSASPGVFAPSLSAIDYGGSYQIHFATPIKAIRLGSEPIVPEIGASTRNCVGFELPGIIAYPVSHAVNDATMGSADATDTNSDGTWDLTATPNAGYTFTGWSCTASQTPASSVSATTTVIPTAATTCTATFAAVVVPKVVTPAVNIIAGGTATATDGNSDGTWDLVATPNSGYSFTSWSCTASQTPGSTVLATTTITPTADTTCTATFTLITWVVTPVVNNVSGGTATATDGNSDGTWDLVATTNAGYNFSGWSCTASQIPASTVAATTTITPAANTTCTATFTLIAVPKRVTARVSNDDAGRATATDANLDGTWDLRATAKEGYLFTGWTCSAGQVPADASQARTTITPTQNTRCTANFRAKPKRRH